MSALPEAKALRVAILGGGVAGCAFTYGLRQHNVHLCEPAGIPGEGTTGMQSSASERQIELSIFEMGSRMGGRASTRGTRQLPSLMCDHGAPYINTREERFRAVLEDLAAGGFVKPFDGVSGTLTCPPDSEGCSFTPHTITPGSMYVGTPSMSALCEGLLRGGHRENSVPAKCHFGTLVSGIEWIQGGGWRLLDKNRDLLGEYDWLVVSASAVCSPRWTQAFGGQPPLLEAAAAVGDPQLDGAIATISQLKTIPVNVVMMAFTGDAAAAWGSLPWSVAICEGDKDISRILVTRQQDGTVTVVLHSTHEFSMAASPDVYGSTSSAARHRESSIPEAGGQSPEAELIESLLLAARQRLVPRYISETDFDAKPVWGPLMHRWVTANYSGTGLAPKDALVPSAHLLFAGDFVSDKPTGLIEDAVTSGLAAADALTACLPEARL